MKDECPDKEEIIEIRHETKVSYPTQLPSSMKSKSHSFYIVQERDGTPISWKKPLIDSCQMTSTVQIATAPFSEGSFRYAFQGTDTMLGEDMVMKIPKSIQLSQYNIESMKQELEISSICNLIVG